MIKLVWHLARFPVPAVQLPENLVAISNIEEVVKDADIIIFCVPHQFMRKVVSSIEGKVCKSTPSLCIARPVIASACTTSITAAPTKLAPDTHPSMGTETLRTDTITMIR
jgi:glycerol-3-phosphate dehydrogenase